MERTEFKSNTLHRKEIEIELEYFRKNVLNGSSQVPQKIRDLINEYFELYRRGEPMKDFNNRLSEIEYTKKEVDLEMDYENLYILFRRIITHQKLLSQINRNYSE